MLVNFGVWLLPKLSRNQVYRLCQAMGIVAYAIDYRGRETAHENLRVAFAKENISASQIRRVAIGSYQNFARTFLDLFWSARLTTPDYAKHVQSEWEDADTQEIARKRGSLWITPHFGSFEILNLAVGAMGISFVTIAQNFKNQSLTSVFAKLRQGTGHQLVPQQGAMLRFVKELGRGGHASMLSDLTVKPSRSSAVITCFGLKTCVPILHTQLAARLNLPMIPATCVPVDEQTYRCHFSKPLEPKDFPTPAAMAQEIWDQFEPQIRTYPEKWLWMYKHWRYLPGTEEDCNYPAYANPNREFRAMLETA
ncbi:MAG: lysophospholipid acyltransferase family protein [Verrucomicrobium sp.]